jgi:hypothetical protein
VTVREVAESLALSPEEVQAFYKMGLRARSYILMSMHSIISALANKYAGAFSIGREVGGPPHSLHSLHHQPPAVLSCESGRQVLMLALVVLQELIQEGFRGAMKAVENYDQAKGGWA